MYRRPTTQTNPGVIQKFIDTAFDELMVIVDNLDMLKQLATSYQFSLIYLGLWPSPPTTRLDGNPIQDGDYYVRSTDNSINFWDAGDNEWIELSPVEIFAARDLALKAAKEAEASATTASGAATTATQDATTASNAATEAVTSATTAKADATRAETARAGAEAASQVAGDAGKLATAQANIATVNADTAVQKAELATTSAANAKVSETNAKKSETSAWEAVGVIQSNWANGGPWDATAGNLPQVPAHNTQWLIVRPGTLPDPIGAVGNGDMLYYYVPDAHWYKVANPHAVSSVNGMQGAVVLDADDVGAMPVGSGYTKNEADTKFYSDANKPSPATLGMYSNAEIDTKDATVLTEAKAYTDVGTLLSAAMTKSEFDALREKRKSDNAGSGFLEWGKHYGDFTINEGLWTSQQQHLTIGRTGASTSNLGVSRTLHAIGLVDGVEFTLTRGEGHNAVNILFPPAPNGTKTYDSATGTVVQHQDAATAFAAETATNKVITSRQDLVFLEVWHEEIAEKDVVFPYGNVQYGTDTWNGFSLSNTLVAQGYSAFGEWDTETKGYCAIWSTMREERKLAYLQDPKNNIYRDGDKLIQVRYRIRVVEGRSDGEWNVGAARRTMTGYIHQHGSGWSNSKGLGVAHVQGNRTTVATMHLAYLCYPGDDNDAYSKYVGDGFKGTTSCHSWASIYSYNNVPLMLPICSVQRLNQGAYHPVWNKWGCDAWKARLDSTTVEAWYNSVIGNELVSSVADCFRADYKWGGGNIGGYTGRADQYPFYDAIYAGQVKDLRLSARVQDTNKLLEDSIRKAVSGKTRGWGKVPFTKMVNLVGNAGSWDKLPGVPDSTKAFIGATIAVKTQSNEWAEVKVIRLEGSYIVIDRAIAYAANAQILMCYETLTAQFDSLPWVDIIGSPERIAATFPNGVVGQWIPADYTQSTLAFPFNRKCAGSNYRITYTDNNGSNWTHTTIAADTVKNETVEHTNTTVRVGLLTYETLSNFTEPANNSKVVGEVGDVWYSNMCLTSYGNRLIPSLSGEVGKNAAVPETGFCTLTNFVMDPTGNINPAGINSPAHSPIKLATPQNNSPAVKALHTLTEKDGLLYMQYHGCGLNWTIPRAIKEDSGIELDRQKGDRLRIKYPNSALNGRVALWIGVPYAGVSDYSTFTLNSKNEIVVGTSNIKVENMVLYSDGWGDDSTIPIINGEGTKTDLNGQVVPTFCHREQIPIGIAGNY